MNCKYCDAALEEGVTLCPVCGKEQEEEVVCACGEECCVCGEECPPEIPVEEKPKMKKKKLLTMILAIVGCVILLGVLAFAVLRSMGVKIKLPTNDIYAKKVYMLEPQKAEKASEAVVAVIGDRQLTNGELQIYFWTQVYDFIDYYGATYFDPYAPMDQQVMDTKTGMTWEQYFLDIALQTWQRYATLRNMAEAAGFAPSQEVAEHLQNVPQQMEEAAKQYNCANADELIKGDMGPAASLEAYVAYVENYYIGLDYFDSLYETLTPTQEEIEAYYAANEATLKQGGVSKEAGLKSDVRHILVTPEGGTENEDGSVTYSEEEWATALATAEEILANWKEGDATEEIFTKLAQEHSDDPGVTSNSGLYQGITATASYLEEFRAWAVDSSRKEGDTGIVKTTAGYHIMYFVTGEEAWITACRNNLVSDKISASLDATIAQEPMKVNYKKLVLGNALAEEIAEYNAATAPSATVPSTEAATEPSAAPTEESK